MTSRCDIVTLPPITLALTETLTRQAEIPARIGGMFDIVYGWLRSSNGKSAGHNHVLYDRFSTAGMRMRVGFPVAETFPDTAEVKCLEFVGGRAAHTTCTGPYNGIPAATMQLDAWCKQHDHALIGTSLEVYGDWLDDQAKLVTDIYFLLR